MAASKQPRSQDYRHGYANGFAAGRRHRAKELDVWKSVFDDNERLQRALALAHAEHRPSEAAKK